MPFQGVIEYAPAWLQQQVVEGLWVWWESLLSFVIWAHHFNTLNFSILFMVKLALMVVLHARGGQDRACYWNRAVWLHGSSRLLWDTAPSASIWRSDTVGWRRVSFSELCRASQVQAPMFGHVCFRVLLDMAGLSSCRSLIFGDWWPPIAERRKQTTE